MRRTLTITALVITALWLGVAPADSQGPRKGGILKVGMIGEPEAHYYFHRPLGQLLGACFAAGFVLDGLEEPSFGPEETSRRRALGWGNFRQIPPVLAARLRLAQQT